MKRIAIALSLWSPRCRAMQRSAHRGTIEIHLGQEPIGHCCHGTLTIYGLPRQYQPS